jgi:hypothetical protein|uniref:C2H2-type domain-containing protein n=1 Tax=viral metagenome TaxID=1070528 RepID=A0A6C0LMA3_9ZZZZ
MSLNNSIECVASIPSVVKYVKNTDGDYVCPHNGCGKIAQKQNTMHYHIMKNHSTKLPFECNRCENRPQFLQRCGFMNHLATKHADTPKLTEKEKEILGGVTENPVISISFKCPHTGCNQSTKTKSNMLIHYARTHATEWIPAYVRGVECTNCNVNYSSSSAYLYHSITCFRDFASVDQLNIISRIR